MVVRKKNVVETNNEMTFDLPDNAVYFGFIFRGGNNKSSGILCTTSIKITRNEADYDTSDKKQNPEF